MSVVLVVESGHAHAAPDVEHVCPCVRIGTVFFKAFPAALPHGFHLEYGGVYDTK